MNQYKEEKRQIDFLLNDLYFVTIASAQDLVNNTVPQNEFKQFAIVEFGTRTSVYDVITHETYPVIPASFKKTLSQLGTKKCAYSSIPLARMLKKAGFTKCDPLLTKEDVVFLRSELAKYLQVNTNLTNTSPER